MKEYCELHGHLILGTPGPSLEAKLQMLKDNNVKYFRDGGAPKSKYDIVMSGYIPAGDRPTDLGSLLSYIKNRAMVYSVIYKTPVYALYKDGHYGKFLGESYNDVAEFRAHLAELKYLNADFVKVVLSGIADFNNPGQIIGEPIAADEIEEIVIDLGNETTARTAADEALDARLDIIEGKDCTNGNFNRIFLKISKTIYTNLLFISIHIK